MSAVRVGVDSLVVLCAAVLHVGAFQGCFLDLTSQCLHIKQRRMCARSIKHNRKSELDASYHLNLFLIEPLPNPVLNRFLHAFSSSSSSSLLLP